MDVQIVLFDGFDELDAIGPYEVVANAATWLDHQDQDRELTVSLRTVDPVSTVTASHGLRVEPGGVLADPDLLVVPGGGWADRADAGAWAEAERGTLPGVIADRYEAGATVAAVCTGGMLLARAGILDGRPAVTHHTAMDELRETAAEAVDARVVDAGDVVTAGGVTAGIDLAFHLVERSFGHELAVDVAREMEYERRGETYRA